MVKKQIEKRNISMQIRECLDQSLNMIDVLNTYLCSYPNYQQVLDSGVFDPTVFVDLESNFQCLRTYMNQQEKEIERLTDDVQRLLCKLIIHLSDKEFELISAELQLKRINLDDDELVSKALDRDFTAEEFVAINEVTKHTI